MYSKNFDSLPKSLCLKTSAAKRSDVVANGNGAAESEPVPTLKPSVPINKEKGTNTILSFFLIACTFSLPSSFREGEETNTLRSNCFFFSIPSPVKFLNTFASIVVSVLSSTFDSSDPFINNHVLNRSSFCSCRS